MKQSKFDPSLVKVNDIYMSVSGEPIKIVYLHHTKDDVWMEEKGANPSDNGWAWAIGLNLRMLRGYGSKCTHFYDNDGSVILAGGLPEKKDVLDAYNLTTQKVDNPQELEKIRPKIGEIWEVLGSMPGNVRGRDKPYIFFNLDVLILALQPNKIFAAYAAPSLVEDYPSTYGEKEVNSNHEEDWEDEAEDYCEDEDEEQVPRNTYHYPIIFSDSGVLSPGCNDISLFCEEFKCKKEYAAGKHNFDLYLSRRRGVKDEYSDQYIP